jgi:alpha-tubulin suppressor-like RCC1 family protein
LVITDESSNNLYCCGSAYHGEHGLGDDETITHKYINVSKSLRDGGYLLGKKIIKIACGYDHSAIIDSDNNLYTCGNNEYGNLGHDNTDSLDTFAIVSDDALLEKCIDVDCGYLFTVVITNDLTDNLYVCGKNDYGQLGIDSTDSVSLFTNNLVGLTGKKIVKAKCSNEFLIVMTDEPKNNVYVCGNNGDKQIGLLSSSYTTFQNILIDDNRAFDVVCSEYSSFILTNKSRNNLYVAGNDTLLFGNGDIGYETFTPLTNEFKISYMGITKYSGSVFCIANNKLYVTGYNDTGQLSNGSYGSNDYEFLDRFVKIDFNIPTKKIITAQRMTLVITREKTDNFIYVGQMNIDGTYLE